jgi:hypothetical protein
MALISLALHAHMMPTPTLLPPSLSLEEADDRMSEAAVVASCKEEPLASTPSARKGSKDVVGSDVRPEMLQAKHQVSGCKSWLVAWFLCPSDCGFPTAAMAGWAETTGVSLSMPHMQRLAGCLHQMLESVCNKTYLEQQPCHAAAYG